MKKIIVVVVVMLLLALSVTAIAISYFGGGIPGPKDKILPFENEAKPTAQDISTETAHGIAKGVFEKLGISAGPYRTKLTNAPLFSANHYWEMNAGEDATLKVEAKSGRVLGLVNYKMSHAEDDASGTVTASEAKNKALKYAADLGLTVDRVVQPDIQLLTQFSRSKSWLVRWPRTFHGIPYAQDAIDFDIGAKSGGLLIYSYRYPSQEPVSSQISLDEKSARSIAQNYMTGYQRNLKKDTPGKLMVVNPNYYWTEGFNANPVSEAAVGWVFKLQDNSEIWVSAKDGKILGGVHVN